MRCILPRHSLPILSVSSADADPDGDNITNFSEYVLGTDPWVRNGNPILTPGFTLDLTSGLYHFSATFQAATNTEGKVLIPQVTENLGTRWRADQIDFRENGFIATGVYQYLAFDHEPANLPVHRFIRLLIAVDSDNDGLPDDWELAMGLDPTDPFDAMTDSDGDGDSNLTEFLHGTNPHDPNDNSRRDDPPRAPRNVKIVFNKEGTRDVVWEDVSDNEQFFVIYGTDASGNQVELGRVGPNETRFHLPTGY